MAMRLVLVLVVLGRSWGGRVVPEYAEHRIEDLCAGKEGQKVTVVLDSWLLMSHLGPHRSSYSFTTNQQYSHSTPPWSSL